VNLKNIIPNKFRSKLHPLSKHLFICQNKFQNKTIIIFFNKKKNPTSHIPICKNNNNLIKSLEFWCMQYCNISRIRTYLTKIRITYLHWKMLLYTQVTKINYFKHNMRNKMKWLLTKKNILSKVSFKFFS